MSPRTVLYGLRNTRKQATDQQCPRPRPHTTAHWHRMHTGCDRQAAARIPIAFAPGTPALAFPAVSSPEACATPALRPWVIVVWVPVPGRYPTTLNRSSHLAPPAIHGHGKHVSQRTQKSAPTGALSVSEHQSQCHSAKQPHFALATTKTVLVYDFTDTNSPPSNPHES